jgi:prepilin-type N-terminal cleavage/methylation domain-containing protein
MGINFFRENKGLSLIELLIVLVLSGILTAALYRTFINQQKIYTVQEQVVEMQQNMRFAIDRMAREIRMAGYGGNILAAFGNINTFTEIITPVNGINSESITIIMADEVARLSQNAATGTNQLQLNVNGAFDTGKKKYLCLGGQNNYLVQSSNGDLITTPLTNRLLEDHLINEPVYLVKAITYKISPSTTDLVRDENAGGGGQVVAENIESLQFKYTLSNGTVVDSPGTLSDIRMVSITITGRTKMADLQYPGDGYRRQTVNAAVQLRNMGL